MVTKLLKEKGTIKEAAKELGCCEKTLSSFMKRNNIPKPYINKGRVENILGKGKRFKEGDHAKAVYCQELNKSFNSLKECAQWLIDNGYSKASTMDAARKGLSRHLNGGSETYLKMHFNFI